MMSRALAVFVALALLSATTPAIAQDDPPAAPAAGEAAAASVDTVQTSDGPLPRRLIDVGDLWRHVRGKPTASVDPASESAKRPFFFVSPSVSAKPSTGLSVGIASSVVFVDGDPSTTHISSGDLSVSDSVKGQAGTSLRFRVFTPDNRWFIQGDNRLAWTSQDTYPLGIEADVTGEKLKFNRYRLYETVFRQLGQGLFVGFGLNVNAHTNVRAGDGTLEAFDQSAYVAYNTQHGLPMSGQVSSGVNVGMFIDTRDNAINASRGWLASATYRTFFDGFLGGTSSWQTLQVDARTYKTLSADGRQKVGVWLLGEFVTAGTAPYLDLPAIADDTYGRSARGYTSARFRGPHLVYGEAEYRSTLSPNGLLGAVAFANATAIDGGESGRALFSTLAPAAGGGLRVLLSKRSRANLCLDYGWGIQGSRGFYLSVRETF